MIEEVTETGGLVDEIQKEIENSLQLAELTRYAVVDTEKGSLRVHAGGERALAQGLEALGVSADSVTSVDKLEEVIGLSRQVTERDLVEVVVPRVRRRKL